MIAPSRTQKYVPSKTAVDNFDLLGATVYFSLKVGTCDRRSMVTAIIAMGSNVFFPV